MSSTVSSLACEVLRDCDFDMLRDSSIGSLSIGSEMERLDKIGVAPTSGTSGGGLRGGEPDDSGAVTRKNSSAEPALFFFAVTTKVKELPLSKKGHEHLKPKGIQKQIRVRSENGPT